MENKWTPRDALFITTQEAADVLRVHPRTIVNLIQRKELGAIRVGSDYRIPRPALEAYQRRQATSPDAVRHLSAIAVPEWAELRARIADYERTYKMTTDEFVREYSRNPDDARWASAHHRWAALADAMRSATAVA